MNLWSEDNVDALLSEGKYILNNTYQKPIILFITGGEEIRSTEGITQGDPLVIAMYALAISPLIQKLKMWFADDCTSAGIVKAVR